MGDEEFNTLFNEIFGKDFTRQELGLNSRTGSIELERQGKRVREALRTSLANDPAGRQGIKDFLDRSEDRKRVVEYNAKIDEFNALEALTPYFGKPLDFAFTRGQERIESEKTVAQFDAEVAGLPAALRESLTGQAVDAGLTAVPTRTRRSVSSSRSKSSISSALLRS